MRLKLNGSLLAETSTQKVLSFLVDHPNEELTAAEIEKSTRLSKAGTYRALDSLQKIGYIHKNTKGRFAFYEINKDDCFVRQYKVLKTVELLKKLTKKLELVSQKIILFGSASRGEDLLESDIDLFILAISVGPVQKILKNYKSKRKLQNIIKSPVDFAEMEASDPEFINEIKSGIVLWETRN